MVFVLVFWYNIFFNPQLMINSRWTIIQNFCFSIWIISKMSIENILLVILIPYAYLLSRIHSYQDSTQMKLLFSFFLCHIFLTSWDDSKQILNVFLIPLFKNCSCNWLLVLCRVFRERGSLIRLLVLWSICVTILLL